MPVHGARIGNRPSPSTACGCAQACDFVVSGLIIPNILHRWRRWSRDLEPAGPLGYLDGCGKKTSRPISSQKPQDMIDLNYIQ